VVNVQYHKAKGLPICTEITTMGNDKALPWLQEQAHRMPYILTYGKSSKPSCRGCHRPIEKTELRIQTRTMYQTPECGPGVPITVSFCLDSVCLQNTLPHFWEKVSRSYLERKWKSYEDCIGYPVAIL
jgi:hypothetical protein